MVTSSVKRFITDDVANNSTASTVAFIAPGPPNPPITQLMYVGVTFTFDFCVYNFLILGLFKYYLINILVIL